MTFPRPIISYKQTFPLGKTWWWGATYMVHAGGRAVKFIRWDGELLINGVRPHGEYTRASFERVLGVKLKGP